MTKTPLVSIIIPLYVICNRFFEDFKKFDSLKYPHIEIIVVCDKKVSLPKLKRSIKFILTNKKHTGPAEKRDLALKYVKGDICAFIDDDAYPRDNWIKEAIKHFKKRDIVAVGGPGVTPPNDSFLEKIGGYIIESYLCSGGIQYRFYQTGAKIFVNDYPAYNLFVRTSVLKKVGGYGSTFYGGEDTLLCMKLIKYGSILYDSNVVVYHHRRKFPIASLKQIAGVGLHRGYFFMRYPETSRRLIYLIPITLTIGFLGGIVISLINPKLFLFPFLLNILFFLVLGLVSVLRHRVNVISSAIAGIGIMLTHITYGVFFVKGLLTRHLDR
jgi:cellulose synthase/poly-beta-1,6-N-acetylglucosamine synthase-like glycosyltransferase